MCSLGISTTLLYYPFKTTIQVAWTICTWAPHSITFLRSGAERTQCLLLNSHFYHFLNCILRWRHLQWRHLRYQKLCIWLLCTETVYMLYLVTVMEQKFAGNLNRKTTDSREASMQRWHWHTWYMYLLQKSWILDTSCRNSGVKEGKSVWVFFIDGRNIFFPTLGN